MEAGSNLVAEIKDNSHHNTISEEPLRNILSNYIPSLAQSWPAHNDVLRAFKVFDTEGVGFIKVTMLKRFLVQSQLEVDESVCKSLTPVSLAIEIRGWDYFSRTYVRVYLCK